VHLNLEELEHLALEQEMVELEHQIQFLDQMYLTLVVAEAVNVLLKDKDNLVEELEVVVEEIMDPQEMEDLKQLQEVITPEAVAVVVEIAEVLLLLLLVKQVVQA
tara:strand:+ start:375 stop:689 length:315 start_codon:yes stop_codon:yes gene_type:complete